MLNKPVRDPQPPSLLGLPRMRITGTLRLSGVKITQLAGDRKLPNSSNPLTWPVSSPFPLKRLMHSSSTPLFSILQETALSWGYRRGQTTPQRLPSWDFQSGGGRGEDRAQGASCGGGYRSACVGRAERPRQEAPGTGTCRLAPALTVRPLPVPAAVCQPPCQNRGSCSRPQLCVCRSGFRGARCEEVIPEEEFDPQGSRPAPRRSAEGSPNLRRSSTARESPAARARPPAPQLPPAR